MQNQTELEIDVYPELLDEDDLKPLGDVVFFGGSRVHPLEEVTDE